MRRIINGLDPDAIAALSLEEALTDHARTLEANFGVPVVVHGGGAPDLDSPTRLLAYRLVAEAMTNAAKHAAADRITVELASDDEQLCATVSDDGHGMPTHGTFADQLPPNAGTGLTLLAGQVRAWGGSFHVDTDSRGTTVHLRVPVRASTSIQAGTR
jgi:signal transduction histidine kinase